MRTKPQRVGGYLAGIAVSGSGAGKDMRGARVQYLSRPNASKVYDQGDG